MAHWLLFGILVAALLVRVAYLTEIAGQPDFVSPGVDAGFHQYWANAMVTGDWTPPPGAPDPETATTPFVRPPGYPYLLAMIYTVAGPSYLAPRVFNVALGLCNCLLAYVIGRRWYGTAIGLVWATFMGAYWSFVYFEGELHAVVPVITLLLATVYALGRWREKPHALAAIAAGLLLGAAGLFRPNVLPLVVIVAIWMLIVTHRQKAMRQGFAGAAALAVASILAIAPVTLRNYYVADDVVLVSANAGVNLYVGNNPEANGHAAGHVPGIGKFHSPFDYPILARAVERETGCTMKFSEVSGYFADRALDFMREHPGRFLSLTATRAALFWGPVEVANNKEIHFEREFSPVLSRLPGNFPAVVALALVGCGILIARAGRLRPSTRMPLAPQGTPTVLVALFVIGLFAAILPFFVAGRYRVPLIPLMLLFAAIAVCRVAGYLVARRWAPSALSVFGGVAAFLLFSTPIVALEPSLARWHLDRGLAFGRVERFAEALPHYEAALQLQPDAPFVRLSMAHALRRLERFDEAGEVLERVVMLESPYLAEARVMMAEVRLDLDDRNAAIHNYRQALALEPARTDLRERLGWLLASTGQSAAAAEELGKVLDARPRDSEIRFMMGMALRDAGRVAEGNKHLRTAMSQNPALVDTARAYGIDPHNDPVGEP